MRTIVTECHDLGATIVAEGIETAEQARLALVLGCDLGQGYLWAPALPVHKAELLLSAPRPTTAWGAASDSPPALSSSISS
jgi:EAL domain-containing protein (putative c-di-GMP-specific phosphodiesterase class I)